MSDRFSTHVLTPTQEVTVGAIRGHFSTLAGPIEALPPSRYKSLALTALEEACMWAVKAISFQEELPE